MHAHKKTRDRQRCLSLNHSPPLHMCPSELRAKMGDMLWELWEQKQFSPWDKQEASPRPAPFLLRSANSSIQDKEEFNQQWSSPTVSINNKLDPMSSDKAVRNGIWCLWAEMRRQKLESIEQIKQILEAKIKDRKKSQTCLHSWRKALFSCSTTKSSKYFFVWWSPKCHAA